MMIPNIKKIMKQMMSDLSEKPDENLINGYKKAMEDYEETGDKKHKIAADIIKKEIDRRGLEVETTD